MHNSDTALSFTNLFWFFVIGCIAGVIIETIWCLVYFGRFESRVGLLYGPFNQIYGFGVVILTLCIYRFQNLKWWQIVLICAVVGGIYEYLCSYVQEKLFGTMSWDYTGTPLSINGRTSVIFAAAWGLLGLLWIKKLMPVCISWIQSVPKIPLLLMTFFMVVFFIFNFLISSMAVSRQLLRYEKIPADNYIASFLDNTYPYTRLQKIYPNMVFLNAKQQP